MNEVINTFQSLFWSRDLRSVSSDQNRLSYSDKTVDPLTTKFLSGIHGLLEFELPTHASPGTVQFPRIGLGKF